MGTGEFGNDIGVMFDGDYCEQSFVNNSLSFNGIDNYVTLSSNENIQFIDNEITFTAWVKIPSDHIGNQYSTCLLYTSPSPRDGLLSRMPSSA